MKIDVVKYLVEEIAKEKEKFILYEKEQKRARKEAKETGKYHWEIFKWEGTAPSKTKIKEYCKMARRLLQEIANEVTEE